MTDRACRVCLLVTDRTRSDIEPLRSALHSANSCLEIDCIADVGSGLDCLDGERVDLVLAHLSRVDIQSLNSLARIPPEAQDVPLVIVPGSEEPASSQGSLWDEAPAYLVKEGLRRTTISRALRRATGTGSGEEPLRQQSGLLGIILEALTYPFYVVNVEDYTITLANAAAAASSAPVDEGETCYALTHNRSTPCEGRHHPCPLKDVARSGEPTIVEHIHYDAEGNAKHVEVHGYPVFDDAGNVVQMIEYTLDITERKQAQEELRKERDLVARLMDTSPVSITMVNRSGRIIFANARAEQVLGLCKSEIIGRAYDAPAWDITDLDGQPFPEERLPFSQVMETEEAVYDVRHAIQWPDGRRRLLSINGAPLVSQSGEVERVVFAIEDITERLKEEQERIRRLKQELHRLESLATLPHTDASARAFGIRPLREAMPHEFQDVISNYETLMDEALDRRAYRTEDESSDIVHRLGDRLGALGATPRDVIDAHIAALRRKQAQSNPIKAEAYAKEARLIALQVMGDLVSYYRKRCVPLGPPHHDSQVQGPNGRRSED